MQKSGLTRRAFLAGTTTTAALSAIGCKTKVNAAQVVPRKISPNEKVNLAGIGVGGMGSGDIRNCAGHKDLCNVVALCDVDWKRAEETFYHLKDAKKFKDYRVMLEEMGDEIDACTISTPDHTHAPAAYTAMMMGKHVRVQKPLTHTIAEARLLTRIAEETGVTTAMGNQGHSGDGVRELCEMVWAGAVGDVKEAHIWTNRPVWPQGITKPFPKEAVPDTMDWDLWLGTAPMRDYNHKYAPFNWRGWWDFGCGAIGDMACHIMDPAFWSLKLGEASSYTVEVVEEKRMNDQTGPIRSTIKYQFPARAGMPPVDVYWYDGKGNLPPRPADVPADAKLGDGDNGSLFIGTDGYLTTGCYGGGSRLLPEEKMNDYTKPDPVIPRIPNEDSYGHWLNAIRTGEKAISSFDYAGPLTEVANMGNVALFAGEKIAFDVKSMEITNSSGANKYLTKKYRRGWKILPL
jgi:predicted dehydrogenase